MAAGLRQLVFHAHDNGLDVVVRRVLIDEAAFFSGSRRSPARRGGARATRTGACWMVRPAHAH